MCQTAHHPLQAIGPSAAGPRATFIWSCGYGSWAAAECPSQKEGQEGKQHTCLPHLLSSGADNSQHLWNKWRKPGQNLGGAHGHGWPPDRGLSEVRGQTVRLLQWGFQQSIHQGLWGRGEGWRGAPGVAGSQTPPPQGEEQCNRWNHMDAGLRLHCAKRRLASQEIPARAGEGTHWLLATVI